MSNANIELFEVSFKIEIDKVIYFNQNTIRYEYGGESKIFFKVPKACFCCN